MVERPRPPTRQKARKAKNTDVPESEARIRRPEPKEAPEKIGYKSPPVHSRFQPGMSGNSRGRPKDSRNLKTIIQAALSEKIVVREGEKQRSITKLEGIVLRQVEGALRGNHRAALATLKIAAQVGLLDKTEEAVDALALTETEQQIIDELLARSKTKEDPTKE